MAFAAENSSPTPPHKGEGLSCRTLGIPFAATWKHPQFSPSHLWVGVGEGTFSEVGGST